MTTAEKDLIVARMRRMERAAASLREQQMELESEAAVARQAADVLDRRVSELRDALGAL